MTNRERIFNTVSGRAQATNGRIALVVGVSRTEGDSGPTGASVNRAVRSVPRELRDKVNVVARLDGRSSDEHYGTELAAWLAIECNGTDAYDAFIQALETISAEYDGADIAVTVGEHLRVTSGDGAVPTYSDPLEAEWSV